MKESLQAIEDYYLQQGLIGEALYAALAKDQDYQRILAGKRNRLTQKFHVHPEDAKRYILSTDGDYAILHRIYQLETRNLSSDDAHLVRLIRSQLEHEWRTPLIKELDRLLDQYSGGS